MTNAQWQRWQARGLIKQQKVKVENISPGLFLFKIKDEGQEINVSKNHKGWMCDAQQDNHKYDRDCYVAKKRGLPKPGRWSCSFRKDGECYHILACKMIVERLGISSEKDLPPGQSLPESHKIIDGGIEYEEETPVSPKGKGG